MGEMVTGLERDVGTVICNNNLKNVICLSSLKSVCGKAAFDPVLFSYSRIPQLDCWICIG